MLPWKSKLLSYLDQHAEASKTSLVHMVIVDIISHLISVAVIRLASLGQYRKSSNYCFLRVLIKIHNA
jgi:hypothetical protein